MPQFLTGVFLCLFIICTYDLYRRRKRHETQLSWPMALAGISLILLATARFIVDVTYIFIAFIQTDPRDARLGFLQDVTVPLFTAKHSLFITSLFIGDLFVVRSVVLYPVSAMFRSNLTPTRFRTIDVG